MANSIGLNTTDHPTLTQVLIATTTGLFDFKAQQAAGSVNVASDPRLKAVILNLRNAAGKPYLTES